MLWPLTGEHLLDVEKIKSLRAKKKLTQADAAKAAGFKTLQAWSSIERGAQPNPSLDTIERIAAALGVKAKDLLK
jgi:transcriptional regulator with XRE-family HTH domain